MSSMRALQGIRSLCVLAATAAILVAAFQGTAAGQMQSHGDSALTTLWSNFIWRSIPDSDLKGLTPGHVNRAYEANNWRPFFITSRFELNSKAEGLLARLRSVDKDAIDPGPFQLDRLSEILEKLRSCRSALRAVDPQFDAGRAQSFLNGQPQTPTLEVIAKNYRRCFQAASEADIRLTTDFFLLTGEMDPFSHFEDGMKALLGDSPISRYFGQLEPKGFGYEALRSAYERYRELAAADSRLYVYISSKLSLGDSGKEIGILQKKLRQEGVYGGEITGVYDRTTQRAIREFQRAHMLTPDGVTGRRTIAWLNVSFKQKAALIAYSLKAVRNSPSRPFNRFIRINIPQFMLGYYNDGQLQKADKVVVGKASGKKVKRQGKMVGENQTPTMVSQIDQIVFNPRWYVDSRIRLELNKDAKSDPEWFEEHGYVKMESRYAFGQHRLFQKPGPKNALGRVKFEFPNPYVVYLHDTNQKYLFDRARRDFSHGCIRVDNALELAQAILNDDANPYVKKIDSILKGTRQVFVKLSKPVPISVEYIPVVADVNGRIVFAGDPYGVVSESSQLAQK